MKNDYTKTLVLITLLAFATSCTTTAWRTKMKSGEVCEASTQPQEQNVNTTNATYTYQDLDGMDQSVRMKDVDSWHQYEYVPWPSYIDKGFFRTILSLPFNIIATPFVALRKLW